MSLEVTLSDECLPYRAPELKGKAREPKAKAPQELSWQQNPQPPASQGRAVWREALYCRGGLKHCSSEFGAEVLARRSSMRVRNPGRGTIGHQVLLLVHRGALGAGEAGDERCLAKEP